MTAESQPLRPEHEEMLRAIVTGERQTDDAEVQAATAEDAEFASRLAELQAAQDTLQLIGKDIEAANNEPANAADAAFVRQQLQKLAQAEAPRTNRPRQSLWLLAAAAAIALMLWRPWSPAPTLPPQMLGDGLQLREPAAGTTLTPGRTIHWLGPELASGERYVLQAWTEDAAQLKWQSHELTAPSYALEAADLADWPGRIQLRVVTIDAFGSPTAESAFCNYRRE